MINTYPFQANRPLPAASLNAALQRGIFDPVAEHDAPTDGIADAAAAINLSIADAVAAGGGIVRLRVGKYAILSADVTIPVNVTVDSDIWVGNVTAQAAHDLTNVPAFWIDSARTIRVAGALRNVACFRLGLTHPTTLREALDQIAAYAGTAITIAGRGAMVECVFIVGFERGIDAGGGNFGRLVMNNINIDCLKPVRVEDNGAVVYLTEFLCTAFISVSLGEAGNNLLLPVSGAADNGAGRIRVTVTTTGGLLAGDKVVVSGVVGFTGANGRWLIQSVVDATHVDLDFAGPVASESTPTTTGTWTSGSQRIAVASVNSIGKGQVVAGANIAGGSVVVEIDYAGLAIWVDLDTTGAGVAAALTFTNAAYSSGGTLFLNASVRPGPALECENGVRVTSGQTYGYDTGIRINGAGTQIANFQMDVEPNQDPSTIGLHLAAPLSRGNVWVNGLLGPVATPVFSEAPEPPQGALTTMISSIRFQKGNEVGGGMSLKAGHITFSGCGDDAGTAWFVSNDIDSLHIVGLEAPDTTLYFDTNTGRAKTFVDPTTILSSPEADRGRLWGNEFVMTAGGARQVLVGGTTWSVYSTSGVFSASIGLDAAAQFFITGAITPTALAGDVDNYGPTGFTTAAVMRLDAGAANRNITGLASASEGRIMTIINVGAANNITLVNNSGASTAGNRFRASANIVLAPNDAATVRKDTLGAEAFWRPIK